MSIVREKLDHGPIELMVLERTKGEWVEPWAIVRLDAGLNNDRLTPRQLRELGRWLTQQGKRIGREYKSNGAKREATP